MKITKTVEKIHHKNITKFFVDEVHVATCKQYKEWFCTVKKGTPSNIRDRIKTAKETSWELSGLIQLLGDNVRNYVYKFRGSTNEVVFKDSHPDLTWGDSGSVLTPKKIKESFENYATLSQGIR